MALHSRGCVRTTRITMNVEPSLYNQQNQLQLRDAAALLEKIKQDYENETIGIAVDIGCGTGNVTSMIESALDIESLVGFDLSAEMIAFARSEYMTSKVRFEVANASQPWNEMRDILNIREEQVDLVFSVHCLHWVPENEKSQAMDNIRRMLRPGGRAYLLFFSWTDLLPLQERMTLDLKWKKYFASLDVPEEKQSNNLAPEGPAKMRRRKSSAPFETFETPSEAERLKTWNDLCVQAGLSIVECKVIEAEHDFGHTSAFRDELRALCHFLPWIPEAERDEFLQDYYAHIDRVYVSRNQGNSSNAGVVLRYQYITVIVEKL